MVFKKNNIIELIDHLGLLLISGGEECFRNNEFAEKIEILKSELNESKIPELIVFASEIKSTFGIISKSKNDNKILTEISKSVSDIFENIQNCLGKSTNEQSRESRNLLNVSDEEKELYHDFITESMEHIQQIEKKILELENNKTDMETINEMFRCFHSIKGNSGFLNLSVINTLSHGCEGILDNLRNGKIKYSEIVTDIVLESVDLLKKMLNDLDSSLRDNVPVKCDYFLGTILEKIEDVKNPDLSNNQTESESISEEFNLLPQDADQNLISEFITECQEYISNSEAALLSLESNPDDMESVNTCFRAFHTIKGTSGFLGITAISELAHHAESLLSQIRDRKISYNEKYADIALRSIDTLKELLQRLQKAFNGESISKPSDYDTLIQSLKNLQMVFSVNENPKGTDSNQQAKKEAEITGKSIQFDAKANDLLKEKQSADKSNNKEQQINAINDIANLQKFKQGIYGKEQPIETTMRVRTDRLDRLINMVGELVISHSMVSQDKSILHTEDHELAKKISHSGKIVRELQDLSMSMRMVPLKPTFQKMTRLVRDLARKSGKTVNFITTGDDTEIDRNMVDVINDPLVHILRNAVDHGIELPDLREKKDKPREGTIVLSAYHSGGNIAMEIKDDGNGLDREKIITKAINRGLIESSKTMTDSEAFNLIFEPGFSTADKITDISGRGVGLDVAKKGVEALRGRINITSAIGKGCTFSIHLPLTMAITDGMLVKVGDERYIIPTINISMSFRSDPDKLFTVAGKGEMVIFRNEAIPLFRLHRIFQLKEAVKNIEEGLLVIIDVHNKPYAILVDELLSQQQVVAKPLGNWLGNIPGVSGGAILGDGRVGLILDPAELEDVAKQMTGCDLISKNAA